MTREQAIGNLRYAKKWKDRPTDEALNMAIEALKQEPKTGHWIPIISRPLTDEEKEYYQDSFGCDFEAIDWIYDCPLPDDGQTVLITDRLGNVEVDTFCRDDGCYFECNCDADDVLAWMPLPAPFEPQESEG